MTKNEIKKSRKEVYYYLYTECLGFANNNSHIAKIIFKNRVKTLNTYIRQSCCPIHAFMYFNLSNYN